MFLIVCKFGGSASTKIEAIKNIKQLCKNKNRKVFIFSAIGKENNFDKKTTDILLEISQNKNVQKNKKLLLNKFQKLKNILNININEKYYINKYINNYYKNNDTQSLISKGEYLTTLFMSKYLNIKFIPAEKIIFFENNKINYKKTQNKLKYYQKKYDRFLTCGFYGKNEFNKIQLFSRGGSDITGAIISKCLGAKIYENWKDTYGIMQLNPKIMKSKQIKKMNYSDLFIMTSCDANVIHNDCVNILKDNNITLKVGNIFDIKSEKTIVSNKAKSVQFVCYKKKENFAVIFYRTKSGELFCTRCDNKELIQKVNKIYKNVVE